VYHKHGLKANILLLRLLSYPGRDRMGRVPTIRTLSPQKEDRFSKETSLYGT
jgi:hypothetical protein